MVKLWPGAFRKHGHILPTMFILLFFTASCTDDEVCEEATANALRIGFYLSGQETETSVAVDSLSIYAIGVADSLVYDNENNVARVEIPLDPLSDSCGYVFVFYTWADTLWFHYERETQLISVECGFTMFYKLNDVEHTSDVITNLGITEPYITNTLNEHIKVYLPDPGVDSD